MSDAHADAIDIQVGRNLRLLRKAKGLTQKDMAQAVEVVFQQYQKYENGSNRLCSSRLYKACKILEIQPGTLFKYIDASEKIHSSKAYRDTKETEEIITHLIRIGREDITQSVLILLRNGVKKSSKKKNKENKNI